MHSAADWERIIGYGGYAAHLADESRSGKSDNTLLPNCIVFHALHRPKIDLLLCALLDALEDLQGVQLDGVINHGVE